MSKTTERTAAHSSASKLTFHAVERIMERSARAPSWLAAVLNHGEFARLAFAQGKQKRFVLVFDALMNTYLIAVLPARTRTVITVLTQTQYENTHGPIASVMFQLAQLARARGTLPLEPEVDDTPQKRLAKKQARRWHANWRVTLVLQPSRGKQVKLRVYLDSAWRQETICAQLAIDKTSPEDCIAAELPFERQAQLLAKHPAFLGWLVQKLEKHGENLEDLTSVTVYDSRCSKVNLTRALHAQLTGASVH